MIITKLYKSIQFGRYLKSLTTNEFCALSGAEVPVFNKLNTSKENAHDFIVLDAIKLRLRDDFDKKLEQQITEGMFWNELMKPNIEMYRGSDCGVNGFDIFHEHFESWQAAEEEVIFEGWKWYDNSKVHNPIMSYVKYDKYIIHFNIGGDVVFYASNKEICLDINTLEDIANATNGKLNINIEI